VATVRELTPEGQRAVEDVARRHGVSVEAALTMLHSLVAGGGTQAQFNHPELGGMGQWSQGGMTMVGDMFNNALKAKVDALCSELSTLLAAQPFAARPSASQSQSQSQGGYGGFTSGVSLFVPGGAGGQSGGWWPDDLGVPSSTGSQNNIRYAFFPATRRLAIELNGRLTVYDTQDHAISGVSQQQSGDASLTFTSQYGLVRVADLRAVSPDGPEAAAEPAPRQSSEAAAPPPAQSPAPSAAPVQPESDAGPTAAAAPKALAPTSTPGASPSNPPDDIFAKIERLADLRAKGILTEEEFAAKKAELLDRL
jgi:Short C-terminal domain